MFKVMGISKTKMGGLEYASELAIMADEIRKNPYLIIKQGLFYHLAMHQNKQDEIIRFIQEYGLVERMSVDDILTFVNNKYEFENISYTLPEDNGVIYLEKMITDFGNII